LSQNRIGECQVGAVSHGDSCVAIAGKSEVLGIQRHIRVQKQTVLIQISKNQIGSGCLQVWVELYTVRLVAKYISFQCELSLPKHAPAAIVVKDVAGHAQNGIRTVSENFKIIFRNVITVSLNRRAVVGEVVIIEHDMAVVDGHNPISPPPISISVVPESGILNSHFPGQNIVDN